MAMIRDRYDLGKALKAMRMGQGVSIRSLADRCGFSPTTIVNVEGGKYAANIDVISKLVSELGGEIEINIGKDLAVSNGNRTFVGV